MISIAGLSLLRSRRNSAKSPGFGGSSSDLASMMSMLSRLSSGNSIFIPRLNALSVGSGGISPLNPFTTHFSKAGGTLIVLRRSSLFILTKNLLTVLRASLSVAVGL